MALPDRLTLSAGERRSFSFEAAPAPRRLIVDPGGLETEVLLCPEGLPCSRHLDPLRYGDWPLLLPSTGGRLELVARARPGPGKLEARIEPLPPGASLLEALTQATLGTAESTPGKDRVGQLRRAAEAFAAAGDPPGEAWALHAAGVGAAELRQARDAEPLLVAALAAWEKLGQDVPAASARQELASAALLLGEIDRGRELDRRALATFEARGITEGIAATTADLGLADHLQGKTAAALQAYRRALEVYRRAGDRRSEATLLVNIAGIRAEQADGGGARVLLLRALALRRQLGDGAGEIEALNNLAVLHRQMGEPEEALRIYEEVIDRSRAAGTEAALGRALNNQGYAYFSLGDWERAAAYFEQALVLRRRQGDRRGEQATLANLGEVELLRGRPAAARDYHRQSLELARGISERVELGSSSLLGRDLAALGDPAALTLLEQTGRQAAAAGDPALQEIRFREAAARLDLGQPTAARELFAAVQAAAEKEGRGELAALAAAGLGRAERRLGHGEAALAACRQAIAWLEAQRSALDNASLRATLLAARGQAFETFVLTASEMAADGRRPELLLEALTQLERSRARGLLDLLAEARQGGGAPAAVSLLADRREVLRRMALLARQDELARQGRLKGDPTELAAAIERARVRLERIEAELRRGDPRLAALAPAEPAPPATWRRAIGERQRLVYFLLGEEKSLALVVGATRLDAARLPPRGELEPLAREAAAALAGPGGGAQPALGELATRLIAPLAPLLGDADTLWVVADGGLHYLPFAALPWPGPGAPREPGRRELLLDRFEIASLPSGAVLAELLARPGRTTPGEIAIFADPVFTLADARRRGAGGAGGAGLDAQRQPPMGELTPLPGTRIEAERIAALAPGRVHLALGFTASRAELEREAPRAAVLHLATHGLIDTDHPELSGLALSLFGEGGRWQPEGLLRWDDFAALPLDADLVVLSGCRTALGRQAGGEGLLGLSRALFYAGSRRVLASLWPVRDRATAELMERFYRQLLAGRPAAAALRAAQRELAADPRWADPFHWAAFVLIGDPR